MSNGNERTPESEARRAARGTETARRIYSEAVARSKPGRLLFRGHAGRTPHKSPGSSRISTENAARMMHAASQVEVQVKKDLDASVGRQERRRIMREAMREAGSRRQREDIRRSDI